MKITSLTKDLAFNHSKPAITILLESEATKEIRVVFKKGQVMKSHKTPFQIVVELFQGQIDFGVNDEVYQLSKGDLITLEGNILHHLTAKEDSIVRLSLSLKDNIERVKKVATSTK